MSSISRTFAAVSLTLLGACATDGPARLDNQADLYGRRAQKPIDQQPESGVQVSIPAFSISQYKYTTTNCIDVDGLSVPVLFSYHDEKFNKECSNQNAALTVLANKSIKGRMRGAAMTLFDPQYKKDVLDNLVLSDQCNDTVYVSILPGIFGTGLSFIGGGFSDPDKTCVAEATMKEILASRSSDPVEREWAWRTYANRDPENYRRFMEAFERTAFKRQENREFVRSYTTSKVRVELSGSEQVQPQRPATGQCQQVVIPGIGPSLKC